MVTGCGASKDAVPNEANQSTGETTAEKTETSDSGEKVTLRLIESLTNPERTAVLEEMAQSYESKNPNVTIELISPPFESADKKISQMLSAGEPLDIVEVRDHTIAQYVNNDYLGDMSSAFENWEYNDTLAEGVKGIMTRHQGKMYMIPSGLYQRVMFYRKDIFDELKLSVPTTYEELLEVGKKITDPSKNRYGFAFRGAGGVMGNWSNLMLTSYLGTDKFDENAAFFLDNSTETIFSTPEAVETLKLYKQIYEEISPKDSIAWGFNETVQGFLSGTCAILLQDPEVIGVCQSELEDSQWGVTTLPKGKAGQAPFENGYAGWGVTSYSEHPEVAADFIKFLSEPENNVKWSKSYSTIPIHLNAGDIDPFFKEGPFAIFSEINSKPDEYPTYFLPNMYVTYSELWATADEWVQKYLQGQLTAEELANYFTDIWKKGIEKEGKLH